MTVRLSHRQKPDTQDYIFQALGSPFSLTGIAALLRIAYRMSIPDKIPYVLSGQPATVSKLPPVWGTLPAYSVAATTPMAAQALPVSVPGGGSPTITVAWHSSSVPSTKPSWVTLTSGTTPTIAFTGDANQVDSADVSSMVISATANGQTVLSSAGTITVSASGGLSVSYGANEGYTSTDGTLGGARPRLVRGQMWYESAYATKDGTLIEHADGAHGTVRWSSDLNQLVLGSGNRVGEWNPATGRLIEVYPGNKEDHGVSSYDNTIYCYFDAIDSLVLFKGGAFYRPLSKFLPDGSANPSGDTMVTRTWTGPQDQDHTTDPSPDYWSPSKGSTSNTGTSAWNYHQNTGTSERFPRSSSTAGPVPSGRPLVFSSNASLSPAPLMYVPAARLAAYEQHVKYYNAPVCYSRQFDVAMIIGGAPGSSDPYGGFTNAYVSAIIPMNRTSVGATARYYVNCTTYNWTATQVGTGYWLTGDGGRSGCKFLNNYVYWVGGRWNSSGTPWLWRADIRPVLANPTSDLSTTFVVEQLASLPGNTMRPLLTADPYSNTLLCISELGIHLYDVASDSWTTRTSEFADYAQYWTAGSFPSWMHGDFIDRVTSTGSYPRKTYFYGGWDNNSAMGGTYNDKLEKVRSIKVTRGQSVTTLNVAAQDPETLGATTNLFLDIKHQGLLVTGTGSSRKINLISGDFSGYPSNTNSTSGYKAEGTYAQDGRQDIWSADIGTSEINSGTITFKLISNAYAAYPWNGSAGVNAGAVKPPAMMDALGSCVDSRGQIWIGPCDGNDYNTNIIEARGQTFAYSPMVKWTKPGTNSTGFGVSGVALGNGWEVPPQDKLYKPGSGGTFGVDYNVSFTGAGDGFGWGRTSARCTVYDSTNDKIYCVSIGLNSGAKQFSVQLYEFNPNPTAAAANGGVYAWAKKTLQTKNCKDFGGLPNSCYTGMNMSGWGDNVKGTINCSPQMIGRNLYFVATWSYTGLSGGYTAKRGDAGGDHYTVTHLMSINVDTLAMEWIPLPQNQNWWLRAWDGPDSWDGYLAGQALTPAEKRCLACVGTKLVLGPDLWTKIGVDPWIQVYDTVRKVWTPFSPPTDSDWPNTLHSLVAMPELDEVWVMGSLNSLTDSQNGPYRSSHGMHYPPLNAGRRIFRFKVN